MTLRTATMSVPLSNKSFATLESSHGRRPTALPSALRVLIENMSKGLSVLW